MTVIRYIGVGDINTYIGSVTKSAYPFGLFRLVGYVDSRDVPGKLEIVEDGLKIFEVVNGEQ